MFTKKYFLYFLLVVVFNTVISAQNLTDSSEESGSKEIPDDSAGTVDVIDDVNDVTSAEDVDEKVMGMNIGLFYILKELQKHPSTELLIKVLVLTSKIEHRGAVSSLNKERMKIISELVPTTYKEAICL